MANKQGQYGHYLSKDELNLPWINCLWCDCRDKIEFDLSLHMLEEHKQKLLQLQISNQEQRENYAQISQTDPFARFYGRLEYRLDKAVEIAKRKGRFDRAVGAVRSKS